MKFVLDCIRITLLVFGIIFLLVGLIGMAYPPSKIPFGIKLMTAFLGSINMLQLKSHLDKIK